MVLQTHRLAAAEAHPNIALEPNIVTGRELERIERRQQRLAVHIVCPVTEYAGVCSAAVLICHDVLVLNVVLHCLGDTGAGETAVDTW